MDKTLITEITEADFRKLDLRGKKRTKNIYGGPTEEVSLNDVLTQNIEYWLQQGYQSDREDLMAPVTIAIHKDPDEDDDGFYFDKYMNMWSCAKTFEIGMGIPHIYSTRDYLESRTNYWRVRKNETKVLYRIHLERKWLDRFVLKHREETVPWPDEFPKQKLKEDEYVEYHKSYDLQEDGTWKLVGRSKVICHRNSTSYIPVDEYGNEVKKNA